MNDLKERGAKIREARIKKEMSRAELARRVNISEDLLTRMENGEVGTRISLIHEIENALDVTAGEFLNWNFGGKNNQEEVCNKTNSADEEAKILRDINCIDLPVQWSIFEIRDDTIITDAEAYFRTPYCLNRRTMKEFLYSIFILNVEDAKRFCLSNKIDAGSSALDVRVWNKTPLIGIPLEENPNFITGHMENPAFLRFTMNEWRTKLVHWFITALHSDRKKYIAALNSIKRYAAAIYPDSMVMNMYASQDHSTEPDIKFQASLDPGIARVKYNGSWITLDQAAAENILDIIMNQLQRELHDKNIQLNWEKAI